jgi:hypothetical protein
MAVENKPKGVNILAVLICIGGVMDIQNFLSVLIDPNNLSFYSNEMIGRFNFYISLPVGLLSLIVAYGFYKGYSWGWSLGLVTALLGITISLVNLFDRTTDPIVLTIILTNAFTIYYLTRPHMKKYFLK